MKLEGYRFLRDGYTVARGVLPPEGVQALRAYFDRAWDRAHAPGDHAHALFNLYGAHPALRWLAVWPPILDSVRVALDMPGGATLIGCRAASAQRNKWSAWHRDTYGQEKAGFDFASDPACAMAQTALYLQTGSLDVVLRSHRDAPGIELGDRRPLTLNTAPGDCVIFHTRLLHRGSAPLPADEDRMKYVVLNLFAARRADADAYHAFIETMRDAEYRYLKAWPIYPLALVEAARAAGLELP